jgi:hypothetical protein
MLGDEEVLFAVDFPGGARRSAIDRARKPPRVTSVLQRPCNHDFALSAITYLDWINRLYAVKERANSRRSSCLKSREIASVVLGSRRDGEDIVE